MPLLFAPIVGLLLGISLCWVARAELGRSEVPLLLARPFVLTSAFGALVFAPVVGYFAASHGDWAYLYLLRSSRVPSAVDLLLVVAAGLAVPVGFAMTTSWAVARRGQRVLQLGAALAGVLLVATAVTASRLSVSASFVQFHGGFGAVPLGRSSLGRGMLLSWTAIAIGYVWSLHALRRARAR